MPWWSEQSALFYSQFCVQRIVMLEHSHRHQLVVCGPFAGLVITDHQSEKLVRASTQREKAKNLAQAGYAFLCLRTCTVRLGGQSNGTRQGSRLSSEVFFLYFWRLMGNDCDSIMCYGYVDCCSVRDKEEQTKIILDFGIRSNFFSTLLNSLLLFVTLAGLLQSTRWILDPCIEHRISFEEMRSALADPLGHLESYCQCNMLSSV